MRNTHTPIAVEGFPFIAAAAALSAVVGFLYWRTCAGWLLPILGLLLIVTGFIVFFFRNPQRSGTTDERAVLAPADGVIVYLGDSFEEHLGQEMSKVSIFMSVFNVHVNRAPLTGRVIDTFYVSGKFLDVRHERATFENERLGIILEAARGVKIVVVQVAGLIARRIVCYAKKGDTLNRGERYGLIRFGSRLDVYLPKGTEIKVAMGEKTRCGETVLGILP